MDCPEPFHQVSYRLHENHFDAYRRGGVKASHAHTWTATHTVDAWRHRRMYRLADPLIESDASAQWLTVGDGRYGGNAHYIRSKGVSVLATDISAVLLKEGVTAGYIDDYRKENAEALSFKDRSFDFVLCKESFHHFPRPMVALYEMLRVARVGVMLIEPNDAHVQPTMIESVLLSARRLHCRLTRRPPPHHQFEAAGNYVYGVSRREIEKAALGINLPVVAFKGVSDHYTIGVEYAPAVPDNQVFRSVQRQIRLRNLLAALHIRHHSLLSAVLLHRRPSALLRKALSDSGFEVVDLPSNPYTNAPVDHAPARRTPETTSR